MAKIFKAPKEVKPPKMEETFKGLRKFKSFMKESKKTLKSKSYKLPKMPKLHL